MTTATETAGGPPAIPPEMLSRMRAAAPAQRLPGTENFPPQLAEALSRLRASTPENATLADNMIRDINELARSKPEAAQALLRVDAGMLLNAYTMKQRGTTAAWDKMVELAQADRPPEQMGWLRRQMVRAKFMAVQGLKSGAIMGAFTLAFKGGAHLLGYRETAGTEFSGEVRSSNQALLDARALVLGDAPPLQNWDNMPETQRADLNARGAATIPNWATMTQEQRNHILYAQPLEHRSPMQSLAGQTGMTIVTGIGLGATFAGVGSQGTVDQAVREREMEIAVWNMMHGGGASRGGDAVAAAEQPDIERPNVPQRGGAPSRGLFG